MDLTDATWRQIDRLAAQHHIDRADVITGAVAIAAANPKLLEDWLWDQSVSMHETEEGEPVELAEEVAHG